MSYEEGASSPSGDEDGDVGRTIRTSPAKVPRLGSNGVRLMPGFPELQVLTTGAELQTLAHMVQAEVAAVQQSSGGDAGTSTSLVTMADGLNTTVHNGDAVQACRRVNRMQWYACFGAWVLFGPACPRYLARVPHSFGPHANSKHPRVLVFVWLVQASRLAREPPMRPRALINAPACARLLCVCFARGRFWRQSLHPIISSSSWRNTAWWMRTQFYLLRRTTGAVVRL